MGIDWPAPISIALRAPKIQKPQIPLNQQLITNNSARNQ